MKQFKNILFAFFSLLFLVSACTPQLSDSYIITGQLEGLPDGVHIQLIPVSHDVEKPVADTVVVGGRFVFQGVAEEPRAMLLMVKDSYGTASLMLENGRTKITGKVTVKDNGGTPSYDYSGISISGSPATEKYRQLLRVREPLDALYQENAEKYKEVRAAMNQAKAAKNQRWIDSIKASGSYQAACEADRAFFAKVEETYHRVVMQNKDTYWGPLMMISLFSYFTADQLPWYEALSPEAQKSYYGQQVIREIVPPSQEGHAVPAFVIRDKSGKAVTLAELCEGKKYILIDFWASWCSPCRKEIPNLKKLYAQYADKGFQIISISIDKKEKDWLKALEEEKLAWPNFRDTEGIADLYKVKFVPTMYLIDQQGIIIGDKLHGEALAEKLKEVFPS